MKLFLALLFLFSSPLLCSDLDSLWNDALKSAGDQRVEHLTQWIQEAKTQNTVSPEAYFNLAQAYWSQEQVGLSVYHLLLSTQLRSNIFSAWGDLTLLNRIQRALLDSSSPLESASLRTFLLCSDQVKFFGKLVLVWTLFLALILRFGFIPARRGSLFLIFVGLGLFLGGLAVNYNEKNIKLPSILNNQNELVPVFRTAEAKDEKPVLELPSGLLVIAETESGDWVKVEEPTPGWIKKEMMLPFPRTL